MFPLDRWIVRYPDFAVLLILFLYGIYFAIKFMRIPQKVMHGKYLQVIIFTAAVVVITYLLAHYPYPSDAAFASEFEKVRAEGRRTQTVWLMFLVVSGYGLSISLIVELFRQTLMKKELAEKNRTAELALYRAQINPHFFFNTMNTLYGLVVSKSDKAEKAFINFSQMLKYTYSRAGDEHIPIREEVNYIKDYIALQKLRLNECTEVLFNHDIDNEDTKVPPMLMISFIENAFKFGTSTKHKCRIDISIKMHHHSLRFRCVNDIMKKYVATESTSVGLGNTAARLDLLYAGRYNLDISESEGKHEVVLYIEKV